MNENNNNFYRRNDTIIRNESHGHLLRTKEKGTNEGGIAAGFAVLDTPLIIE